MRIEKDDAFRELEPPLGGAARLRARLEARPGSFDGPMPWLGPAMVALVAAIAIFAFRPVADPVVSIPNNDLMLASAFDRLLNRESEPFRLSVIRGTETLVASELEGGDPAVRLYSLSPTEPTETP